MKKQEEEEEEILENSDGDAKSEEGGIEVGQEEGEEEIQAEVEKGEIAPEEKSKEEKEEPQSFRDLGLCEELCQAVDTMGWTHPTEIQRASLPHALAGKDIIALAETGSGMISIS